MAGKTTIETAGGYAKAAFLGQYFPPPFPVGNVFFVSSTHASKSDSAGSGHSPDAPFATLAYAFSSDRLTADNDDYVIVMPGHAETVSAAAGIDADIAGVTVVGLGTGTKRPTITLSTANTADIDIDAANITFRNLLFVANFLDIAAAIDVNAAGFTMENCECRDTSTILNALIWVLGASSTTSNDMRILNSKFFANGTANTAAVSIPGTSARNVVHNCEFQGDWGSAAILAAGVITDARITNNLVRNLDAGDDKGINVADTSTGICAYNAVGCAETDNSTDNITCGTTFVMVENYSVDIGDRQGVLDPIAT